MKIANYNIEMLYEDAKQACIDIGYGSTSLIQRRCRVGYGVACELIDLLEKRGVIGGMNGTKPRELLIKKSHD